VTDLSATLTTIAELYFRRRFYIGVMNKQTNAGKALVRRALGQEWDDSEESREKSSKRASGIVDLALKGKPQKAADADIAQVVGADLAVIAAGLEPYQAARHQIELELARAARKLPIAPWQKSVWGFRELWSAAILGETGNLSNYSNPGKVWSRMGLAPYNGQAYSQWRKKGGLTADEWTDAGYVPRRKSVMFVVGGGLIGCMSHGPRPFVGEDISKRDDLSPYQKLFVNRLRYEAARNPEMKRPDTEEGKESYSKHAAFRAQRIVEKQFLKDLWIEWRRVVDGVQPKPWEEPPQRIAA